ncbi:MAG: peptidase C11, partial [Clostridia bacterium]|nr:peptidase C11 [Clostridia bacterium]
VDDGKGFIDLGLDNVYSFDENGNLVADLEGIWLSINGQIVPYYHLDSETMGDAYRYTGFIPALLNGNRVNLLVVFDNEHEYGYIAGTQIDYVSGETEALAKVDEGIQKGDVLQFLCDYYTYDGTYSDSYAFGDPVTVGDSLEVKDVYLPSDLNIKVTYRITDIYNQVYWTNAMNVVTK